MVLIGDTGAWFGGAFRHFLQRGLSWLAPSRFTIEVRAFSVMAQWRPLCPRFTKVRFR